ncbi:NAD(P)H-binding protein [Streptomyces sp. NBC_00335]|uniref:NAD-dependent epimerase/dehydratase family protein n=1 Tax=unclassified Streptomyces TaxID=2593676 RepID=UPI002252E7F8|nr:MULTISPECIES: NAD(P)H-binding protein [unclassified Streptomyces]MCX5403580.1 NAD(P)H-binding protein [Streptomyces sp. NBC_00086]
MTKTAVVVGATGQIGRVVVRRLAEDGWDVTAISRTPASGGPPGHGVRTVHLDRDVDGALESALGDGCDVLVDMVAYGEGHARQLLGLGDRIGSAVVISSVNVYADGAGRGFDTQDAHFPEYPVPIREDQPVIAPGDTSNPTRKAALEHTLLHSGGSLPVTLVRPGAIHGPGSPLPREWFFVKRALDKRRIRLMPYRGEGRFHTSSSANIAEVIRLAASRPGTRVLNAADPQALTVREIAAAVDAVMGHEAEDVLMDGLPEDGLGGSPWCTPRPVVLDMSAAERELGYVPVTGYAESLPETVEWLLREAGDQPWQEAFPLLNRAIGPLSFDYAAEDRWISGR